jgi:hypothetical protein
VGLAVLSSALCSHSRGARGILLNTLNMEGILLNTARNGGYVNKNRFQKGFEAWLGLLKTTSYQRDVSMWIEPRLLSLTVDWTVLFGPTILSAFRVL